MLRRRSSSTGCMASIEKNSTLSVELNQRISLDKHFDFPISKDRSSMLNKAFDIASFNHTSREVISVEKTKHFYVHILGFEEIVRPDFDVDGVWLYGHGLNLHLVKTQDRVGRTKQKLARIEYFHEHLPSVDHVAFIAKDCEIVKELLESERIYYREFYSDKTGIRQFFFFDPDGNAIEVSNCAPSIGEKVCALNDINTIMF